MSCWLNKQKSHLHRQLFLTIKLMIEPKIIETDLLFDIYLYDCSVTY